MRKENGITATAGGYSFKNAVTFSSWSTNSRSLSFDEAQALIEPGGALRHWRLGNRVNPCCPRYDSLSALVCHSCRPRDDASRSGSCPAKPPDLTTHHR